MNEYELEAWKASPFDDIAMARAIIDHYENMLDGWKETVRIEMANLEYAGDEEHTGEEIYEALVEKAKGDWYGVDWSALVPRDVMKRALEMDVKSALRFMKCLGDEDDESDS